MSSNAPQDFGQPLVLEDFMAVEQPVSASSIPLCIVCHKAMENWKRCSGCKNIKYCSKDCQLSDWGQHKPVCKSFNNSISPDPHCRRALFFSPDQSRPRFIWLTFGNDGTPLDIGKCFANTPSEDIRTIAFHNRFLPYWIQISYDGNTSAKRSLANTTSIQHSFRGPVVALAYDPEEGLSKPALDVDTTTLGPVLEYARLRSGYNGPIFVEQPQERYTEEEWKVILSKALANRRELHDGLHSQGWAAHSRRLLLDWNTDSSQ